MAVRLTELLHQACEIKEWQALKGGTSGRLRTEFPPLEAFLWGGHFWGEGYFAETRTTKARATKARAA